MVGDDGGGKGYRCGSLEMLIRGVEKGVAGASRIIVHIYMSGVQKE